MVGPRWTPSVNQRFGSPRSRADGDARHWFLTARGGVATSDNVRNDEPDTAAQHTRRGEPAVAVREVIEIAEYPIGNNTAAPRLGVTLSNVSRIALVPGRPKRISRQVQTFEILLVADSELVAQALAATLRRAGHRVTSSTTIAGTVETLMRRGPFVDVIMTSTRGNSDFGDDVAEYSRKFAANARFIVLREMAGHVEDIERALVRQSVLDRLRATTTTGWN